MNDDLRPRVLEALKTIRDPEIPLNIYDLGLIYGLEVDPAGAVHVRMTLTTPACPVAAGLPAQVEKRIRELPGVSGVRVELVWDPPWTKERLSEAARLQLGLDDPARRRPFVPAGQLLAARKRSAD
jgi:FeS assembly SUF system protein